MQTPEKAFLVSARSWNSDPLSSIQRQGSKCDLNLKQGVTYLLLSTSKPPHRDLNICNTTAIEIGKAEKIIETLAKGDHSELTPNPSWSYCKKGDTCQAVEALGCVNEFAVNTRSLEIAKKWAFDAAPKMNCAGGTGSPRKAPRHAHCIDAFCELKP
jgi:hypothetical protein